MDSFSIWHNVSRGIPSAKPVCPTRDFAGFHESFSHMMTISISVRFRMMGLTPIFHDAKDSDFSRSSIPDLGGKVALVTGANIGLGLSTVGMLAGEGKMRVIMACRNMQKCREAAAQLESMGIPKERLDPQYLDLSSLKSVAAFADKIQATEKRLDVVVMNAGLGWQPVDLTEDGIEKSDGETPPECSFSS
jgi:hypothetical protein